ncbi:RagB/SusD family nutrient uptake outer membrane protein [Pseudopedobacter sp.]|uniref:RagB/SusD family nutrient uptake outer membrane protein n=1 Tax=Pseudopedobacter sp. TaxID=1936787 RepID=UPI00333FA2D9
MNNIIGEMKTISNKISIGICTVIICLFSSGCEKFLDTKPADFYGPEEYFNTEGDLNRALIGVYDPLGSSELYSYNLSSMFGTEADEGYYNRSSAEGPQIYDFTSAHTRIRTTWQKLYQGIDRANVLLANVNKPEMSNSARNIIIGEAKFLRAFYYFILVSNWGGVPLVLEPTNNPIGNSIARSTDKEIYDFILKEMKEAEGKVRTIQSVGHAGRVTKSAVQGILARVCLYMAGYPLMDVSKYAEARDWAKKVMDAGHALNSDYKQIFINYAQDKYDINESIWEVEFWGNGADSFSEAGWVGVRLGIATTDVSLGHSYGIIRTTEKYFRLFETDDLRRDWTIAPFKYSGKNKVNHAASAIYDRDIGKWRREYERDHSTSLTAQNYPLLRYADVLLMYAEADVMASGTVNTAAVNAYNQVRRRGFGEYMFGKFIKSIKVNSGGTGYTDVKIELEGGGGTGAEATAIVEGGAITGIQVTKRGTGYTQVPNVKIVGTPTNAASATAILSDFDYDLTASQADPRPDIHFLEAIKNERSRELGFEGLRKYDLIRWGDFLTVMKDMEVEISTSNAPSYASWAFRNVGPKNLLFPIPVREIALNNKLIQNPNW